jgi:hypothetical protein
MRRIHEEQSTNIQSLKLVSLVSGQWERQDLLPTLYINCPLEVTSKYSKSVLNFGSLVVGQVHIMHLRISNQTEVIQELFLEKLPTDQGFSVREVIFMIPPLPNSFILPVYWQPNKSGNYRSFLLFKWRDKCCLKVTLIGRAI